MRTKPYKHIVPVIVTMALCGFTNFLTNLITMGFMRTVNKN